MILIKDQQRLLLDISEKLKRKVVAFAIGGTAMMFHGLKDATLDIDLVFKNEEDRQEFKRAARKLGYTDMDPIKIYGTKDNRPEMLTRDTERFDLFVGEVISFKFSPEMEKRAEDTHEFGKNLMLKIADPHDIILMKCATDRIKDKDDAKRIIESQKINWGIIIEEAKNQVKLGKAIALMELGTFLEHLKNEMHLAIPTEVLDKTFSLLEEQIQKSPRPTENKAEESYLSESEKKKKLEDTIKK